MSIISQKKALARLRPNIQKTILRIEALWNNSSRRVELNINFITKSGLHSLAELREEREIFFDQKPPIWVTKLEPLYQDCQYWLGSDEYTSIHFCKYLELKSTSPSEFIWKEDPELFLFLTSNKIPKKLSTIRLKLFPHQQEGVAKILSWFQTNTPGLLGDEMGLGKTLQAIVATKLYSQPLEENSPNLILCPSSLINNWKREINKFTFNASITVYSGKNRQKERYRAKKSQWLIASYSILSLEKDWFQNIKWNGLILDEAHNLRNFSSKLHKAITPLTSNFKLALTGTPIQNTSKDAYHLLKLLFNSIDSKFVQKPKNGQTISQNNWWQYLFLARNKTVLPTSLPVRKIKVFKSQMDEIQAKEYLTTLGLLGNSSKLFEIVQREGIERHQIEIFALIRNLKKVCQLPSYLNQLNSRFNGKYKILIKLKPWIENQRGSLFFSHSLVNLDSIEVLLKSWGWTYKRIDGGTPSAIRQEIVNDFQNGKLNSLILSTKAAGTGLNLTHATCSIFLDSDWNPAWEVQARDRTYRIGQDKKTYCLHLIYSNSIEEIIWNKINEKQKVWKDFLNQNDVNEKFTPADFEQLLKVIPKVK